MTAKSMTAADIRKEVSPMVIWMADATIREARRAIAGKTNWPKPKCHDLNLPEVEMAGEILFRMFETYSMAIMDALVNMPEDMDGLCDRAGRNYFDEFVKQLQAFYDRMGSGHVIRLREADWTLERV